MRRINTPAGKVHSLRFGHEPGSLYFISEERYALARPPSDWTPPSIPGFERLSTPDIFRDLPDLELYQHAYRINARSGTVTCGWPFSGSEVAAFTPDLRLLYHSVSVAVAGGELDLRRVVLATGQSEQVYDAQVPYPHRMAFTPNGHILAVSGHHYAGDGRYAIHRVDVWHRTELPPLQIKAECVEYSPDGHMLATGSRSEGVWTWHGKERAEHWSGGARLLRWSPDRRLAWGNEDQLAVTRPGTGTPVHTWSVTGGGLSAMDFSPDGNVMLLGTWQGVCSFVETEAGQVLSSLDWGIGPIHSVAFSPDGLTCAAGGENGQVVVWDVDT